MVDDKITLSINAEELLNELERVEQKANEVEDIVEDVDEKSQDVFNQIMGGVHALWLTTQGVVRAAGGSISTVFRTVVGTALGTISVLTPLLTADWALGLSTGNIFKIVQASMGLASIGIALGALSAAQAQEREFSDSLRGANMALHGIQSILGVFNFK